MSVVPLFSTHFSCFRSILTTDESTEIDANKQISLLSIAKKHNLESAFVYDSRFSGFPDLYKNSKKSGVSLRYGIKLTLCQDVSDKSDESRKTEHRVIIWMKNSSGYQDLIKVYSKAATEGFYYYPRIDLKVLNEMWSDNLVIMTTPYDGVIHQNLLQNGQCLPDWRKISPVISFCQGMELPWESLLVPAIKQYAEANKFELQEVHPVFYYSRKCFDAYLALRCIGENSKIERPNISYLCSREFCFEAFEEKLTKSQ